MINKSFIVDNKSSKFIKSNIFFLIEILIIFIICFYQVFPNGFNGGDITQLQYSYPKEFIDNYIERFIFDNEFGSIGYFQPQQYLKPLIYIIYYISFLIEDPAAIQALVWATNCTIGFSLIKIFLIKLINDDVNRYTNYLSSIAAITYIFSPYVSALILFHFLPASHLIALLPLIIVLFQKYYETEKIYYILFICIIIGIFSHVFFNIAYLLAILICLIPTIALLLRYKFKITIKAFVVIILIGIPCSLHWLIGLIYHLKFRTGISSVTQSNSDFFPHFDSISKANNIIFPLTGQVFPQYINLINGPDVIMLISGILFLIITYSSTRFNDKNTRKFSTIYISYIIVVSIITVSFSTFGVDFISFVFKKIPLLGMLRNSFEKFSYPFCFIFASLVFLSMHNLLKKINIIFINYLIIIIIGFLIFNSYYKNDIFEAKFPGTTDICRHIRNLDKDYLDIQDKVKYLASKDDVILLLPLTSTNYQVIKTEKAKCANNYYIGPSPGRIFSDTNEINSLLSLEGYKDLIMAELKNGTTYEFINVIKKLRINYVIVNKYIPINISSTYIYNFNTTSDLLYLSMLLYGNIKNNSVLLYENKGYEIYDLKSFKLKEPLFYQIEGDKKIEIPFTHKNNSFILSNINININPIVYFSEPFNPYWYVKNGNFKIYSQTSNNQNLKINSFEIINTNNDSFELAHIYELHYYYSLIISICSISLIILIIIYIKLKIFKK